MTLGPGQYALIASGGLLAASGLWLLLANRAKGKSVPLHIADSGGIPFPSQSTRIVAALVLLIGGSLLMDRADQKNPSDGGDDSP